MNQRFKIYFGIASERARKVALARVRFDIMALVLIASLAIGVMIGYIQARGFEILSEASDQVQHTVNSWAVPPEPAKSQPAAAPPVRRTPAARPALRPGPFVSTPETPSAATTPRPRSVASAAAPIFRVQVGAFRIRSNAEVLVKQLGRDGFDASIVQITDLYKVQIGEFRNRRDASRLAVRLKAKRYNVFVTQAPAPGR